MTLWWCTVYTSLYYIYIYYINIKLPFTYICHPCFLFLLFIVDQKERIDNYHKERIEISRDPSSGAAAERKCTSFYGALSVVGQITFALEGNRLLHNFKIKSTIITIFKLINCCCVLLLIWIVYNFIKYFAQSQK